MFRFFRQLNALEDRSWVASRSNLGSALADRVFTTDTLQDRLVRALAAARILPIKEILECGELFERIREDVRAEQMADLCCGHGLLGILFALFERRVQHVLLADEREPPSHAKLLACARQVGPWIDDKVTFRQARIQDVGSALLPGTAIVSAHACGTLTDQCLDLATALGGAVAVLPCCYPQRTCPAPPAVQLALGHALAYDVDRTYRLEQAGYHVRWTTIPAEITPMNRVLIGHRRRPATAAPAV
jgi:hypothetical protein